MLNNQESCQPRTPKGGQNAENKNRGQDAKNKDSGSKPKTRKMAKCRNENWQHAEEGTTPQARPNWDARANTLVYMRTTMVSALKKQCPGSRRGDHLEIRPGGSLLQYLYE